MAMAFRIFVGIFAWLGVGRLLCAFFVFGWTMMVNYILIEAATSVSTSLNFTALRIHGGQYMHRPLFGQEASGVVDGCAFTWALGHATSFFAPTNGDFASTGQRLANLPIHHIYPFGLLQLHLYMSGRLQQQHVSPRGPSVLD